MWPCKNAAILACGHRRGTLGRPSGDLEAENSFSKKPLNLTTTFGELFCPHRRGHETPYICSESSWRLLWWPPRISKTSFGGLGGHPRAPQEWEKVPCTLLRSSARPRNRSTAFLQWIMAPWALPPCKNAINLPVARGPANMQSIGLAALDGAPSGDLEASKKFFKEASQLRSFF